MKITAFRIWPAVLLLFFQGCDTASTEQAPFVEGPSPPDVVFQIERPLNLRGESIEESRVAGRSVAARNGHVIYVTSDGGRTWTPHRRREVAWSVAPNGAVGFVAGLTDSPAAIAANDDGTMVVTPARYQQTLLYSGLGETYQGGAGIGTIHPRAISTDVFGGFHLKGHQAPPYIYRYFRADANGRNWITKDAISDFGAHYVNPFAPDMVFETIVDNSTGAFSVFQSTDGGTSFDRLRGGEQILALSESSILVDDRGWQLSRDAGATWESAPGSGVLLAAPTLTEVVAQRYSLWRERSLHRIDLQSGEETPAGPPPSISAINIFDDGHWVIAARDGVYLRKVGAFDDWVRYSRKDMDVVRSVSGQIVHLFDVDTTCPFQDFDIRGSQVLVTCHDGAVQRSDDSGVTWTSTGGGNSYVSFASDSVAYSIDSTGDLHFSMDAGRSWSLGGSTGGNALREPIAADGDGHVLVATFGERALRSDDFGQTWYPGDAGLPLGETVKVVGEERNASAVTALAMDASRGISYLGTQASGLFWSLDSGTSWDAVPSGPSGVRALAIEADGSVVVVDWANQFWTIRNSRPVLAGRNSGY